MVTVQHINAHNLLVRVVGGESVKQQRYILTTERDIKMKQELK